MLSRFQSLEQLNMSLSWSCSWAPYRREATTRMAKAIVRHAGKLKTLAYREMTNLESERPDTMIDAIKQCPRLEELAVWCLSSLDIAGICKVGFLYSHSK